MLSVEPYKSLQIPQNVHIYIYIYIYLEIVWHKIFAGDRIQNTKKCKKILIISKLDIKNIYIQWWS